MLYYSFILQELDLNINTKYNINFNNNEKVIYLLPNNGNNQKFRISLSKIMKIFILIITLGLKIKMTLFNMI